MDIGLYVPNIYLGIVPPSLNSPYENIEWAEANARARAYCPFGPNIIGLIALV